MKQRTKADWEKLVKEYRSSGKSLKVWCDENEVNYKTMCGHTHLVPAHNEKRTDKEWIDLINKKQTSGMSREGWCRENGVNPNSMLSAEKRLRAKIDLDNVLLGQASIPSQKKVFTEDSKQMNTDIALCTDYGPPKWIEVGIEESSDSTLSHESKRLPNNHSVDSLSDRIAEEGAPKESKQLDSKITIRCGKLIVEADANYPFAHLENLIGKLATVC